MGLAVSSGVAGTIGGGRYRLRAVLCDGFNLTLKRNVAKSGLMVFLDKNGKTWSNCIGQDIKQCTNHVLVFLGFLRRQLSAL